ncbi:MAG: arylsulfatase [Aphanocapsa lilacina HA4352-LM1]|jgi:arylsulfatase|nr:arylsulfatase [Aphanocapsa lilacina HA4352-LM1]
MFPRALRATNPVLRLLAGALAMVAAALPVAAGETDFKGIIGPTDKESKPYFPPPVRPKPNSPNVVYIVLDDVGFADLGCYGSEVQTPNIDRLAAGGLRYNNFHTRAICSPTRAALLTGHNSHSVGLRTVANFVTGFPNASGRIAPTATTLAEILRPAGYSTFAVGKWHLVPLNETSPSGPYDQWPLQRGFERYYGFLDGLTDQYVPELVQDNTFIDPPKRPGYHLSEDLVDRSIQYVRSQMVSTPEKPFFLYLAFGAAHAPHQVAKPFIDKYLPVFEKGWDRTRTDRSTRQKQLGIIPASTTLVPPNEGIKPWGSLSSDEKKLFVRFQAAFAGFLEHTDLQIGRLIQFLEQTGKLDNTIVVLISDNGASQEGDLEGFVNEVAGYGRVPVPLAEKLKVLDDIGTGRTTSNYPLGWAMAGNTPLKLYKQTVHGGGVRDPLIVHWPRGIAGRGAVRSQFVDVIDITPTVLDLADIEAPKTYRGIAQQPLDGASIAATFQDGRAPNPRDTQYFEQGGNRALWQQGWKAVALHKPGTDFNQDRWELYNLNEDFSESTDLATRYPEKLQQLQARWWEEARRHGVLPLDGRNPLEVSRARLASAELLSNRAKYTYYPGQERLTRDVAPLTANRSHAITAYVNRPDPKAEGVLLAFGDFNGGYVFYLKDNKLVFDYNAFGTHTVIAANVEVPVGKSALRYQFTRSGDFRGTGALFIDGRKVAEQTFAVPQSLFAAWEGLDVGRDALLPVSEAYQGKGEFAFTPGALEKVVFEVDQPQTAAAANP